MERLINFHDDLKIRKPYSSEPKLEEAPLFMETSNFTMQEKIRRSRYPVGYIPASIEIDNRNLLICVQRCIAGFRGYILNVNVSHVLNPDQSTSVRFELDFDSLDSLTNFFSELRSMFKSIVG